MKDLNRRNRKDSDSAMANETPDFIFKYADSDSLGEELAEWYTYSEEPEFLWNQKAFNETLYKQNYGDRKWTELNINERRIHLIRLLDLTDINNKQTRDNACRSILYIVQGVFAECETLDDYYKILVENVVLLCECDTISIFIDLLLFEVNNMCQTFSIENKYAPCISDNADLRVILSVLYTIIEVVRSYDLETSQDRFSFSKELNEKYANMKNLLKSELNKPLAKTNELFSAYLFQLINKFCNQNLIVLPIKKIILLLWKVLLLTIGGIEDSFLLKNEQRIKYGLPLITENPSMIINQMSPATPPPNPIDLVNELQFSNPNSSYKRKKSGLTKQTRGIDSDDLSITNNTNGNLKSSPHTGYLNNINNVVSNNINNNNNNINSSNNTNNDSNTVNSNNNSNDLSNFSESDSTILVTSNSDNLISSDGDVKKVDDSSSVSSNKTDGSSFNILVNDLNGQELETATTVSQLIDNSINIEQESSTPYPTSNSPPPESNEESKSPPRLNQITSDSIKTTLAAASDAVLIKLQFYNQIKTLPWKPKVRLCELETFLDQERKKFLGYGDLKDDLDTLVGLPYPIHESVKILKQHLYLSLAEEQVKLEEKIAKYPFSTKLINEKPKYKNDLVDQHQSNDESEDDEEAPAELLFASLLNNLPQYLICLLKILLTSVPQTRPKSDSLQIMSDLFPEDLLGSHFLTIKLGIDTNRHKEILIKSISAILLLMLKHFKVNHIYQFEFMSQHLLFANCVPLILKFFNLNISSFIQSKNNNCHLDFPNCVIGNQPELDAEELENGDSSTFRWRNVFSCINLLRILNKLTKYKRSRVMMLVIFKSAPILKKILRVKQAMLQLYALKLLKMQTRHLGRQWRKTNMSTMSAIYQKVRHRLNDDWAFGNEQEAQAWDFQSDECALRAKIDRFIQRRYKSNEESSIYNLPLNTQQQQALTTNTTNATGAATSTTTATTAAANSLINFDFTPTDNSPFSYLNKQVKLPDNFAENYEQWLNEEVFSNKIDWDSLINNPNKMILF